MQAEQKERKVDWKSVTFPSEFFEHVSQDKTSKLHTYRYPAANNAVPKAAIIYFCGHGQHVGKFGYVGKHFSEAGYDFVGFDYKGFGKSQGTRGLIESFDTLLGDALSFVEKAKEFYEKTYAGKNIPLVGYGFSLGAGLQIAVYRHHAANFAALINVSPGLVAEDPEGTLAKMKPVAEGAPSTVIMQFPPPTEEYILHAFHGDDLEYFEGLQAGSLVSMMTMTISNKDMASKISVPTHTSIAKNDFFIPEEPTKAFME